MLIARVALDPHVDEDRLFIMCECDLDRTMSVATAIRLVQVGILPVGVGTTSPISASAAILSQKVDLQTCVVDAISC